MQNHVALTAGIAQVQPLRYSPAGLPVLDLHLVHASQQQESGLVRKVSATVRAVAMGELAQRLARQAPGSVWTFQGFLATPRNSNSVVLHIQDIQQN